MVDDIDPTAPTETLDPMDGDPAESADAADGEPDTSTPPRQATPRVICRYDELPFASQSIDLVALPHVLEFTDDPHEVLREVARVLMPEGRLIITGFNPLSLWGMRQGMRRLGTESFLPAQSQMIAFTRLKDWLKLLGFDIVRGRFGCYCPPNRSDKWLQRTAFMEKAGDRWWPIFGAVLHVAGGQARALHATGRSGMEDAQIAGAGAGRNAGRDAFGITFDQGAIGHGA